MTVPGTRMLKELKTENAMLKELRAESELDKSTLKDLLNRKW
jgi:lambda repressor-like predicted transcriptional regulator